MRVGRRHGRGSVTLIAALAAAAGCTSGHTAASTTAPGFVGASIITACRADVQSILTALQAYKAETGGYPATLGVLAQTVEIEGLTFGPWLRAAPSSRHYTILTDGRGGVYVYPPRTPPPPTYTADHSAGSGDPCRRFASY